MAQETSAQLGAMAAAGNHVDNAGQTLTALRAAIAQAVAGTSSGYQSEAADLFRATMDQWHQDFAKIVAGLDKIRDALGHNARQYEAGMAADRASVNQIAALLNGGAATS